MMNLMKMITNAFNRIKATRGFERVKFVILYGSAVHGRMHSSSDIDLCIYYDGGHGRRPRISDSGSLIKASRNI